MLRPSLYIKDCMRLFGTVILTKKKFVFLLVVLGEVIDHDIMLTSAYMYLNKASAFAETCKLYEAEFGAPYCDASAMSI